MSDKSNALVVHMTQEDLRKIMREESGSQSELAHVVNDLPSVKTGFAAFLLRKSPKTINLWRKTGKIKHEDDGKIPFSEIIRIKMNKAS